jgi:REG-2-like HAD superfamily hydrolase
MPQARFVTFDCAGTLVRVDWNPPIFAADCAERLGIAFDRPAAESEYARLLQSRWQDYQELNLGRSEDLLDGFWRTLTEDWMERAGIEPKWREPLWQEAWNGLYETPSRVFSLYPDTVPCLEELARAGLKLAVLSNWDYSLHRVLRLLGLDRFFETEIASLEEGIEKPEPEIFRIAFERLGARPQEVLHVGDDPLDDVRGALGAGAWAALVDRPAEAAEGRKPVRTGEASRSFRIADLRQVAEVLAWTD